jgi:hypothetical protein
MSSSPSSQQQQQHGTKRKDNPTVADEQQQQQQPVVWFNLDLSKNIVTFDAMQIDSADESISEFFRMISNAKASSEDAQQQQPQDAFMCRDDWRKIAKAADHGEYKQVFPIMKAHINDSVSVERHDAFLSFSKLCGNGDALQMIASYIPRHDPGMRALHGSCRSFRYALVAGSNSFLKYLIVTLTGVNVDAEAMVDLAQAPYSPQDE